MGLQGRNKGCRDGSSPFRLGAADSIHPRNPIPGSWIHPQPKPPAPVLGEKLGKTPKPPETHGGWIFLALIPPGPWRSFLAPSRDLLGFREESAGKGQERELMAAVAPGWKKPGNLWPGRERGMGEGWREREDPEGPRSQSRSRSLR